MEDVQDGRGLVLVEIGVHSILLAVDVLFDEETAPADHKLRKSGAGGGEIPLQGSHGLTIFLRIVGHKDALAQKAHRGLDHAGEGDTVRIQFRHLIEVHLFEEEVGVNIATDAAERVFVLHEGNAVDETLVVDVLVNPSEGVLGNGIYLSPFAVFRAEFLVRKHGAVCNALFRHFIPQHGNVVFFQRIDHQVRHERSF